jgi:hypothetical protein
MKFTSILFTLVASLFLVDSTLAIPAPGWFKKAFGTVTDAVSGATENLDLAAIANNPMAKMAMKSAAGKVPGGKTALKYSNAF